MCKETLAHQELQSKHTYGTYSAQPPRFLNLTQANGVFTTPCTFTNSKFNNKKLTLLHIYQSKVKTVSSLYLIPASSILVLNMFLVN